MVLTSSNFVVVDVGNRHVTTSLFPHIGTFMLTDARDYPFAILSVINKPTN
jgi:hypothetical protein